MLNRLSTLALSGILCMGMGTGAALAQDSTAAAPQQDAGAPMHRRGPMSTEDQLAHLTKALNLTSDQQSQIKPLLDDRRAQMMKMRQDSSMSRDDKMSKMKAIDDDSHSKIAAYLTDAQKPKFEEMAKRDQEHMQHMHGGDGAPAGGQQQPQ